VQILAEQVDHMQASLAVLAQEIQKLLALHHGHVGIVQEFSSHLVISSGQGGAEAEDFAGNGHMQRQALA
jgi:hypothetical protein